MKQTPGLRRRAIFLWWRESEEAIKNVCWELFRNISNERLGHRVGAGGVQIRYFFAL
jgi:hypothetical protein